MSLLFRINRLYLDFSFRKHRGSYVYFKTYHNKWKHWHLRLYKVVFEVKISPKKAMNFNQQKESE